MQNPKFTILISVFKTKYFKEAFESVASQTFLDYEILLLNDGADGGIAWVGEHPRVRYHVNEKNLGPVASWNKGLKLSHGEFVLVFSDDDVLEADFLSEVDIFLKTVGTELDILRVQRRDIDGNGKTLAFSAPGRPVESAAEYVYNQYSFLRKQALQDIVFRRERALKLGGFRDFPRGWGADYLLAVEIAAFRDKIGNLNKPLMRFRLHGASLSFSKNRNYYLDALKGEMGLFYGVKKILESLPGEYQEFALQKNWEWLQGRQDFCFSGTLANLGLRALWRLHRAAPQETSHLRSLGCAIAYVLRFWFFRLRRRS
jgi:glycosyltransferase involved in cell wall biosynthesis